MAALYSIAHAHIDNIIVPDICTLTYIFAWLKIWIIEGSNNQDLDNRGWTVYVYTHALYVHTNRRVIEAVYVRTCQSL